MRAAVHAVREQAPDRVGICPPASDHAGPQVCTGVASALLRGRGSGRHVGLRLRRLACDGSPAVDKPRTPATPRGRPAAPATAGLMIAAPYRSRSASMSIPWVNVDGPKRTIDTSGMP